MEVEGGRVEDLGALGGEEAAGVEFAGDRAAVQGDVGEGGEVEVVGGVFLAGIRDGCFCGAGLERAGGIFLRRRVGCRGDVGDDQADGVVGVRLPAELAKQVDQPAGDLGFGVEGVGAQP